MSILYSHSRLDSYFQCPLKYKYRYLDRIRVETEGIEAFMGSRVHSALEKLYKDKTMGRDNTLEKITAYYDDDWQKNWHENVQIVKKEYTVENYKTVGEQALESFYKRYHPFEDGRTIGLEKRIVVDLNGDKEYQLQGYIDRLVLKEDKIYEIHDYKTSKDLPTQEMFDSDKQLALYQLGVEEMWPDAKRIDLVWHYLRHDTEFRSQRKPEDLNKLKNDLIKQIDSVEKAVSEKKFNPKESALCNWCDYQEICPKRKHLYKVEPLPSNEYLKEDGVSLVNKYVELKDEKKNLVREKDLEIAKVEEALVTLAKKEGYEAIAGSDYQVKIDLGPRYNYPTKTRNPEELRLLEELIQKYGIWDDSSKLDTVRLSALISENGLTEERIKKIKELLVLDERPKFKISKITDAGQ